MAENKSEESETYCERIKALKFREDLATSKAELVARLKSIENHEAKAIINLKEARLKLEDEVKEMRDAGLYLLPSLVESFLTHFENLRTSGVDKDDAFFLFIAAASEGVQND